MSYAEIEKENGVAVVWMDQPGEKVNKISIGLVDEFKTMLDGFGDDKTVRAIVLISRKPDNFIAGADICAMVSSASTRSGLTNLRTRLAPA